MSIALAIAGGDPAALRLPLVVVPVPSGKGLPRALAKLDRATGGAMARALRSKDFKGSKDETLLLYAKGRGPERVLLVGMGAAVTPSAVGRAAAVDRKSTRLNSSH